MSSSCPQRCSRLPSVRSVNISKVQGAGSTVTTLVFSSSEGNGESWSAISQCDTKHSPSAGVGSRTEGCSFSKSQAGQNRESHKRRHSKGSAERTEEHHSNNSFSRSDDDRQQYDGVRDSTNSHQIRGGSAASQRYPMETQGERYTKPISGSCHKQKRSERRGTVEDAINCTRCGHRIISNRKRLWVATPSPTRSLAKSETSKLSGCPDESDQETSAVIKESGHPLECSNDRNTPRSRPAGDSSREYSFTSTTPSDSGPDEGVAHTGDTSAGDCYLDDDGSDASDDSDASSGDRLISTALAELDCCCTERTGKGANDLSAGEDTGAAKTTPPPRKANYSRVGLLSFYLKHAHTLKNKRDSVVIDLSAQRSLLEKSMASALLDTVSQIY